MEKLLQDVLTGSRPQDDPAVEAAVRDDPGFAERLRRMQELQGRLTALGAADHGDLDRALADSSPPTDDVGDIVRRRRPLGGAASQPRGWRWRPLLLSAAGIAAVALLIVLSFSKPPEPDPWLGPEPGGMEPAGIVTEYTEFAWNFPLPAEGGFELSFYDYDDLDRERPLLREKVGQALKWTPTATEREKFTDHMYWEVRVLYASGQPAPGGGEREVELSR